MVAVLYHVFDVCGPARLMPAFTRTPRVLTSLEASCYVSPRNTLQGGSQTCGRSPTTCSRCHTQARLEPGSSTEAPLLLIRSFGSGSRVKTTAVADALEGKPPREIDGGHSNHYTATGLSLMESDNDRTCDVHSGRIFEPLGSPSDRCVSRGVDRIYVLQS